MPKKQALPVPAAIHREDARQIRQRSRFPVRRTSMAPGLLTATFLQPKEVIAIGTNVRLACAAGVVARVARAVTPPDPIIANRVAAKREE